MIVFRPSFKDLEHIFIKLSSICALFYNIGGNFFQHYSVPIYTHIPMCPIYAQPTTQQKATVPFYAMPWSSVKKSWFLVHNVQYTHTPH